MIIPVEIMIPMHKNDFIKRTTISVGINDKWNTKVFATVFKPVNNICTIKFNLLCKVDGEWEVRFLFLSGDSKTYVKNLKKPQGAPYGKVIYHVYYSVNVTPDRDKITEKLVK